jgi:5'-3' exonuclease
MTEYNVRDKIESSLGFSRGRDDKKKGIKDTTKEKEDYLTNVPILYRAEEKYICPSEIGWEDRYYNILLDDSCIKTKQKIVTNYWEGLEWVFLYYSKGCPQWRWKYKYHYPPLFTDMVKQIPVASKRFFTLQDEKIPPFSSALQLAYILPLEYAHVLNKKHAVYLEKYRDIFPNHISFCWAFCRYFWESHVVLPEIEMNLLEQWERDLYK